MSAEFSTGLFDCFSDVPLCLYTCFCAPCSVATNWANINGEKCGLDHLCFLPMPYWTRQAIRKRKHMPAAGVHDALVLCCCATCGVMQDGREIKTCQPSSSEYYLGQQGMNTGAGQKF